MTPAVTVVVPACEEERYIGRVLDALRELTSDLSLELIVVDNGSTDRTRRIAEEKGVRVIGLARGSASAVRNYGAGSAVGKVLIFLDADVEITQSWRDALPATLESLRDDPLQVIGARCHAADDIAPLNRFWFNRLREYSASYVNSGNLMTSRALFDKLGGFDETLTTAEDYDFCLRARQAGARVVEVPALVTLHHGYPDSIGGFIKRERWQGRQDFESVKSWRESKVAWLATLNLMALMLCVIAAIATWQPAWLLLYVTFLTCMSAVLTARRFGYGGAGRFAVTSSVFALYIWGRSLAGVDRLLGRRSERIRK